MPIQALAFSSPFITSIGTYIGHLDASVRRCGMFVAEVIAQCTSKKLDFGEWDGTGAGRPWARQLRVLLPQRDIDAQEATSDIVRLESASPREPSTPPLIDEASPTATHRTAAIHISTADYDSDDSLTGYASPTSSRAPSPTPSELAAFEKDPLLRVGAKKVLKPVYLADVGAMLRSSAKPDDPQEADRIEVALTCAEELIRKKKNFGLELGKNSPAVLCQ